MGLGRPLVGVQIALSLLLLVVAGLFVRSLANLQSVPLGFNTEGLVLFNLDPTAAGYSAEQKAAATERIAARLRQLPGVDCGQLVVDGAPGQLQLEHDRRVSTATAARDGRPATCCGSGRGSTGCCGSRSSPAGCSTSGTGAARRRSPS